MISSIPCIAPSSPNVPCRAMNAAPMPARDIRSAASLPTSTASALYPFALSASRIARPLASETSRSDESPPIRTPIFLFVTSFIEEIPSSQSQIPNNDQTTTTKRLKLSPLQIMVHRRRRLPLSKERARERRYAASENNAYSVDCLRRPARQKCKVSAIACSSEGGAFSFTKFRDELELVDWLLVHICYLVLVIWNLSSSIFSNDLDLGLEPHAALFEHRVLYDLHEREHIRRLRMTRVYNKVGMLVGNLRTADGFSFYPCGLDKLARGLVLRVFEHRSRARLPPGLPLLSGIHKFLYTGRDLDLISAPQNKLRVDDHVSLGNASGPVAELHLLPAFRDDLSFRRYHGNGVHDVPHLARGRAGVHAERAAERSRNADGEFKAREALLRRERKQFRQRGARLGVHDDKCSTYRAILALGLDPVHPQHIDHHAAKTVVPHKEVCAAAEDKIAQLSFSGLPEKGDEIVPVNGICQNVRRSPDTERRMFAQRFIQLHFTADISEFHVLASPIMFPRPSTHPRPQA